MFKKVIILAFFFKVLFFSCANNEQNNKDQIIHGIFSKPFTLDPTKINNSVTEKIFPQLFENLTTIKVENKEYKIIPKLANRWEISEDSLSYYFYLKSNIKFHDGNYLRANDVKISFERQFDNSCLYYSNNPSNLFENLLNKTIDTIEIIDSLKVEFKLKYPNSLFLYIISSPKISMILSSKALQKYGDKFSQHPIGTGPFKIEKITENGDLILNSFKEYWGKVPQIEKLRFKFELQDKLEEQALNNSIDVLSRIKGNSVDRFRSSNKFNFISTKAETIYFLGFNLNRNVIKNKDLREAILLSLDKGKIVNTLNRTNAIVADGPLPIGIFNSKNLKKQKEYDLEKVKELIKKSGYNGSKLILIGFEDSPRTKVFFDIIVNYLNQIGIKIEKKYYKDWEKFLKSREFDDFDLTLEGWGADILGDPYFFLYNLFHSDSNFNVFRYKNEKVDRLLKEAVRTFDTEKRYKMYEEINNIIIEDIPAVFISQIKDVFVVNKRIKNVIINPYRYIEYKDVIID